MIDKIRGYLWIIVFLPLLVFVLLIGLVLHDELTNDLIEGMIRKDENTKSDG